MFEKVPHFAENHEKSSSWPKLDIFRTNWHVLAFWWSFQEEAAKSASFPEKAWKLMDLAKTLNFSNKLACFSFLMNFSAKSCKKCLISWKTMRNHRFGQNLELFEQTGMFLRFYELLSKKSQKVPHFTKNLEKSLSWAKLASFRTNWYVSLFWWTFQQKVWKVASFREKPWTIFELAKTCNFSNKLGCFVVFINF